MWKEYEDRATVMYLMRAGGNAKEIADFRPLRAIYSVKKIYDVDSDVITPERKSIMYTSIVQVQVSSPEYTRS